METTALTSLVGAAEDFLRTDLGRRPRHLIVTDRARLVELLTLADVDRLVATSALRVPAFRLARDGATLPMSRVTRSARIGSQPIDDLIDVDAVHRELADGATIVLQGVHRSWEPVARFCRSLEHELTHPVQANAYLTPPSAQGFALHRDAHDVFAVQTYGAKRWIVDPPDGPRWELDLLPGDVLYLPAGTPHAAQTTGHPSLHLTIGVRSTTWRELLDQAVDSAVASLGDGVGTSPLPAGWGHDPDRLRVQLLGYLDAIAAELQRPELAERAVAAVAERHQRRRPVDHTGRLRDLLEVADLDDGTPLVVRAHVHVEPEPRGDQLLVALRDRELQLPAQVAPVLERMLALRSFTPRELDELIDQPSRLLLCRRLVREGLLTLDDARVAARA